MKELRVTGRILPISEATKRRNPELYGNQNSPRVAGLPAAKPEQNEVHALDKGKKTRRASEERGVVRVTIIRCAARPLDSGDNLNFSYKAVKDAIAHAFGTTDSDRGIVWSFRQIIAPKDSQGTILKFDFFSAQP